MSEKYSYRIQWSDEDASFIGLCAEFPSLSWIADTQNGAFKGICKLVEDVLADMAKNGEDIPEPLSTRSFSGKFMVRVPPELHRELILKAAEAHISLNRYVTTKLADLRDK